MNFVAFLNLYDECKDQKYSPSLRKAAQLLHVSLIVIVGWF